MTENPYTKENRKSIPHLIQTPCGPITGVHADYAEGVTAYKGIRYATAGRFEYPNEVTSWDGIYRADHFGTCSYQPRAFYDEAKSAGKAFYYHEFREGETYTYGDECQYLNIWVPEGAENSSEKLPVLFYIHGGGYTGGCGHEKHFSGEAWAKKGVIFVTINYRLGPYGNLAAKVLEDENGMSGNYGSYDQLTALSWVYHNIAAFGGDPARITLMGQSAGAMSVQSLLVSPLAVPMISRAIMLSGGGINAVLNPGKKSTKDHYDFWKQVMEICGCESREDLMSCDPKALWDAYAAVNRKTKKGMSALGMQRDGRILTDSAANIQKGNGLPKIPYLLCTTSEDIAPPVFYAMAVQWLKGRSKAGNTMCYAAHFKRQLPGDTNGAWHSSDLWYAIGCLDRCWRPWTEDDRKLSDLMITYYSNFAKSGDPNGPGLPQWQAVTGKKTPVMIFDAPASGMGSVNLAALTRTMFTKPGVGVSTDYSYEQR